MQGKEKLFTRFQLSEHVTTDNFYRQLKKSLSLDYLYELTQGIMENSDKRA